MIENSPQELLLLRKFNNRESYAFGEIYLILYKDLNLYATSLYRGTTISSEDVLHDIFMNIWSSNVQFHSLQNIKAYIYISVKNSFKDYLSHHSYVEKYEKSISMEFKADIDIVEIELYSFIDETLKLIPESYAEVLRMYIEGCKSGEIAEQLGRTEQSVYNIKNKALKSLREQLSKDKLLLLMILLKI